MDQACPEIDREPVLSWTPAVPFLRGRHRIREYQEPCAGA